VSDDVVTCDVATPAMSNIINVIINDLNVFIFAIAMCLKFFAN
jgi:hypothetical protein